MDSTKREKVSNFLYPKNAVASIIKYKDKYLFQLRDNKKNIFFPNMWGLFGGAIEINESYLDGLKREVLEELNININNNKEIKFVTNISFEINKKCIERYIFVFKINNDEFKKLKISEGQKIGLFNKKEIKKIEVVPYDSLAIWLFLNNSRLRF